MMRSCVCSSSAALVTESPGQRRRHIEQRAFVQRRHELSAELARRANRDASDRESEQDVAVFAFSTRAMIGR